MSASPRRRPTIRRVRDWKRPETLDDASDLVPTTIARPELVALDSMLKTESGIHDLLFMPLSGQAETMEVVDVELEAVPKKSDIRELAPRKEAPSSANALASLVDLYEARAERMEAAPKTEELDVDAIEEVKLAKRSSPPPLPQKVEAQSRPLPRDREPVARARELALSAAWQLVHLARRWPELWDLDTRTKVAVIAMWMAFWTNVTLLFR